MPCQCRNSALSKCSPDPHGHSAQFPFLHEYLPCHSPPSSIAPQLMEMLPTGAITMDKLDLAQSSFVLQA
eukprot:4692841-Karenia_brevis.AAC.1